MGDFGYWGIGDVAQRVQAERMFTQRGCGQKLGRIRQMTGGTSWSLGIYPPVANAVGAAPVANYLARCHTQAPVVIGGTGGSGTRMVVQMLTGLGVEMGQHCKHAGDATSSIGLEESAQHFPAAGIGPVDPKASVRSCRARWSGHGEFSQPGTVGQAWLCCLARFRARPAGRTTVIGAVGNGECGSRRLWNNNGGQVPAAPI